MLNGWLNYLLGSEEQQQQPQNTATLPSRGSREEIKANEQVDDDWILVTGETHGKSRVAQPPPSKIDSSRSSPVLVADVPQLDDMDGSVTDSDDDEGPIGMDTAPPPTSVVVGSAPRASAVSAVRAGGVRQAPTSSGKRAVAVANTAAHNRALVAHIMFSDHSGEVVSTSQQQRAQANNTQGKLKRQNAASLVQTTSHKPKNRAAKIKSQKGHGSGKNNDRKCQYY